jgi:iron donor protein CyaY
MTSISQMTETEFRKQVQEVIVSIERGFADVDPDVVECEQALGALTITFSDRSRCILSAQPSVRQLWLALASEGTAYHFDFVPEFSRWLDDKGRNIELHSFLKEYLKKKTGLEMKW